MAEIDAGNETQEESVESDFDLSLFEDVQVSEESEEKEATEEVVVAEEKPVVEAKKVEPTTAPVKESVQRDDSPYTEREQSLLLRLEQMTKEKTELEARGEERVSEQAFTPQERNFLEGVADLDSVLSSPEELNKLLVMVYNTALEEASKLSASQIMRGLPETISVVAKQQYERIEQVKDFYTQNPDLKPVQGTVAAVAQEIAAANPEYTTAKLFEETAKKTREILQIKEGMKEKTKTPATKPAFAQQRRSGNRVKVEELSGLEAEVSNLFS